MTPNEQKLWEHQNLWSSKQLTKVNDHVYFFAGYGASNAIAVIGETSVILIDGLNNVACAESMKAEIAAITDKPVKTLIFTHSHFDHVGGSGVFRDTVEEVIALAPQKPVLEHYERLNGILGKRGMFQFGAGLTKEEAFQPNPLPPAASDVLAPTTVLAETPVARVIDGVALRFEAAVGETDDTMFIVLEDDNIICSGDNYYDCWPNLYAPRGSQYRDIALWVDSLTAMLELRPDALLPGHSGPLIGADVVQDVIGSYRDAIRFVLMTTLDCMNAGMSPSEAVEAVKLPEELASKPYLGEYYGTVEWSVRSIYGAYLGWFDGNGANLMPVSDARWNATLVELAGEEKILAKIASCMEAEDYQLALQLADLIGRDDLKAEALRGRAHQMTSINARHYLFAAANELEKKEQ